MTLTGAALLIAIFGVVLAGASLTWQVVTFVANGHRVTCSLNVGYVETRRSAASIGAQVLLTIKQWSERQDLRHQPEQHLFVTAVNKGRSGVWINSVGYSTGAGRPTVSVHTGHPMPNMPTLLEAGQTQVLRVPTALVSMVARIDSFGAEDTDCVHAVISLGTGQTIRTKEGVRIGQTEDVKAGETDSFRRSV